MNLRVLYQTPVLKLMNGLVFCDSFILIFLGIGFKGDQGVAFGAGYGLIGGIVAILMFNAVVVALISLVTRDRRPPYGARKSAAGNGKDVKAKV